MTYDQHLSWRPLPNRTEQEAIAAETQAWRDWEQERQIDRELREVRQRIDRGLSLEDALADCCPGTREYFDL